MSINRELAERFERMAAVLELRGESRFRINAYTRGAEALRNLHRDAAELTGDIKELTAIDGIGKGLAEKIIEYAETGRVEEVDQTVGEVPPGLLDVMAVPGVGPKTAALMWERAGVESIDDLKAKLKTGELEALPRLGAKKLEKIAASLAFVESAGQRVLIHRAMSVAESIVAELRNLPAVARADYAGSLRRGRETIGDVDILAACRDPEKHGKAVGEAFRSLDIVEDVIAAGPTKSSVRLEGGLQADLRIVRADRYGAALMYFTGSKTHSVALRERSIKKNMLLNEYGLWREGEHDTPDARPLAAKTEPAIYRKLGLAYIPPELREHRGEIDAAANDRLPELVEEDDIRCELHAHTTASDGKWSIDQLAAAAKERGYHTVAVTDHSASSVLPNGLSPARLKRHIEAVREANERTKGITILAGSEVDILADGRLDYDDDLLAELDLVVASPHASLSQEPATATKRLLRAIEHPLVHILAHPTGRLINRREGLRPDIQMLIDAAAVTGTAMEINAAPQRLDLRDTHARAAAQAGVKIAINTDAHGPGDLDQIRYGILTARRAWIGPTQIINCMTATQLKKWLKIKRI